MGFNSTVASFTQENFPAWHAGGDPNKHHASHRSNTTSLLNRYPSTPQRTKRPGEPLESRRRSKLCHELHQTDDSGVNLHPQPTVQQSEGAIINLSLQSPTEERETLLCHPFTAEQSDDSLKKPLLQHSTVEQGKLQYYTVDNCRTAEITVHPIIFASVQSYFEGKEHYTCKTKCKFSFSLPLYSSGQLMQFTSSDTGGTRHVCSFAMCISAIASDGVLVLHSDLDTGKNHYFWPENDWTSPAEVNFTNLQFSTATANNGKRKSGWAVCRLVAELWACVRVEEQSTYARVKVAIKEALKIQVFLQDWEGLETVEKMRNGVNCGGGAVDYQ